MRIQTVEWLTALVFAILIAGLVHAGRQARRPAKVEAGVAQQQADEFNKRYPK